MNRRDPATRVPWAQQRAATRPVCEAVEGGVLPRQRDLQGHKPAVAEGGSELLARGPAHLPGGTGFVFDVVQTPRSVRTRNQPARGRLCPRPAVSVGLLCNSDRTAEEADCRAQVSARLYGRVTFPTMCRKIENRAFL